MGLLSQGMSNYTGSSLPGCDLALEAGGSKRVGKKGDGNNPEEPQTKSSLWHRWPALACMACRWLSSQKCTMHLLNGEALVKMTSSKASLKYNFWGHDKVYFVPQDNRLIEVHWYSSAGLPNYFCNNLHNLVPTLFYHTCKWFSSKLEGRDSLEVDLKEHKAILLGYILFFSYCRVQKKPWNAMCGGLIGIRLTP